jgi:hypothetical protein
MIQVLTEPLSTAFELLTKVKAQHENQQQAGDSAALAAASTARANFSPELVQQLQQLESRVGHTEHASTLARMHAKLQTGFRTARARCMGPIKQPTPYPVSVSDRTIGRVSC